MLYVKIQIKGQIDPNWSDWFEGLKITHAGGEVSILRGALQDQAELYGLLARLWNLRLELISLKVNDSQNDL